MMATEHEGRGARRTSANTENSREQTIHQWLEIPSTNFFLSFFHLCAEGKLPYNYDGKQKTCFHCVISLT